MHENITKAGIKTAPSNPEIPVFDKATLIDQGANDSDFNPGDYILEKPVIFDEAVVRPILTREDFTPEAIYRKRIEVGKPELNEKDPIPMNFSDTEMSETIIADEILKPLNFINESKKILTRDDFTPEGIMRMKLNSLSSNPEKTTQLKPFNEADIETIDVTNVLDKPRLTREDFTREAITKTRENNLSLVEEDDLESDFPATVSNDPLNTISSNKLDSATPKPIYKIKAETTTVKKGFFGRLAHKFISRFF